MVKKNAVGRVGSAASSAITKKEMRSIEVMRRATKIQVDQERAQRLAAYLDRQPCGKPKEPIALAYARAAAPSVTRVLADGDSWFDYPIILGTKGGVIDHLEDLVDIDILNMAHHGDPVQTILGVEKRQRLEKVLADPGFDILLFPGGGNDIAGDQFCLWLDPNTGHNDISKAVDLTRFRGILDIVEDGYRDLIEIRDRIAPTCWIVTHAYDFPQPCDDGVCGLGPWLKPSLDYRGWTEPSDQYAIAKTVLSRLNALLISLEEEQKAAGKNFLHIRTQGTLNPSTDWANEIHPNGDGFEKIAKVFLTALSNLSPVFNG
jgi:hypothetical protein